MQEEQSNETTALMEMDEALDVMKTFEIAETVLNPLKEKKWKEKKESLNVLTTFVRRNPRSFGKRTSHVLSRSSLRAFVPQRSSKIQTSTSFVLRSS